MSGGDSCVISISSVGPTILQRQQSSGCGCGGNKHTSSSRFTGVHDGNVLVRLPRSEQLFVLIDNNNEESSVNTLYNGKDISTFSFPSYRVHIVFFGDVNEIADMAYTNGEKYIVAWEGVKKLETKEGFTMWNESGSFVGKPNGKRYLDIDDAYPHVIY